MKISKCMGSNSRKRRRDAWKAKQIRWQDVWELPLKLDECERYAFSANRVMALTFEGDTEELIQEARNIVAIINGEATPSESHEWVHNNGSVDISCDAERFVFSVRGWGHLTGAPMRLPEKEAVRIQDDFIAYILDRLNSYGCGE